MFLRLGINTLDPKSFWTLTLGFRTICNSNVRAMKISAMGPKQALPSGKFMKFCLVTNLKKKIARIA